MSRLASRISRRPLIPLAALLLRHGDPLDYLRHLDQSAALNLGALLGAVLVQLHADGWATRWEPATTAGGTSLVGRLWLGGRESAAQRAQEELGQADVVLLGRRLLQWGYSEFSRIRLQYARSRTLPGAADNQWFVQYILSLFALMMAFDVAAGPKEQRTLSLVFSNPVSRTGFLPSTVASYLVRSARLNPISSWFATTRGRWVSL